MILRPLIIHLHEVLPDSKAMFAHGLRTHYKMSRPEILRTWQSHAGKHTTISSCIIHKTRKHFAQGKCSPEQAT